MKEKTFLQRFWLLSAFALMWLLSIGGGYKVKAADSAYHYLSPYTNYCFGEYAGNPEKTFTMMGVSYTHGIAYDTWRSPGTFYNLDGKVNSVSFAVGHLDGCRSDSSTLKVYLDGKLIYTLSCTSTMSTTTATLDTTGGELLWITFSGGGAYGIANLIGYGSEFHYYEAEMTKNVSVIQDGERTWTCSQCGASYTETVPKQTYCDVYLYPYQSDYKSYTEADGTDDYFQVMGKKYYEGLTGEGTALYNLNGEYTSVTFDVGFLDGYYGENRTFKIYCDGNLQKTETVACSVATQTFTVNVTGVSQLKLYLSGDSMAIFNMSGEKVDATPKAHSYSDETVVEAKLGQTGLIRHKCTDCGASYTETTPALVYSVEKAKVKTEKDSYEYTGSAITPKLTVTYGDTLLVEGTDYTVSVTDNVNAGTANVTVSGIGNYNGSVSAAFTITRAEPSLSYAAASVSKTTADAAFTNPLTATTDGTITYTSDDTDVAAVSQTGEVTILSAGEAVISAKAAEGTNYKASKTVSYTLTVTAAVNNTNDDTDDINTNDTNNTSESAEAPQNGKTYTVGKMKYMVTNAATDGSGTVTLMGSTKSAAALSGTVKVPNTVKIEGYSYRVTAIGAKAFRNYKKITTVKLGKYIQKIGASAFQGCKKLKTISVNSKVLTSVGKNAVKGIYAKAKIKVPSSRVKAYKKLFNTSAGYRKGMKISK